MAIEHLSHALLNGKRGIFAAKFLHFLKASFFFPLFFGCEALVSWNWWFWCSISVKVIVLSSVGLVVTDIAVNVCVLCLQAAASSCNFTIR